MLIILIYDLNCCIYIYLNSFTSNRIYIYNNLYLYLIYINYNDYDYNEYFILIF